MSESTDTVTNPNGVSADAEATLNATDAQLAAFAEWQRKEAVKKAKYEEAKIKRARENNRPLDANGAQMSAGNGFLAVLSELLSEWDRVYANDPETLTRRTREQIIPLIVSLATTPSVSMASAYDTQRRTLAAYMPPKGADPVPAPVKE